MQETFLSEFQKRGYYSHCTDLSSLSELMSKSKINALENAGVSVAPSPAMMGQTLLEIL